jgi:hypothetical protein
VSPVPLEWRPRAQPLEPCAVVARGSALSILKSALERRSRQELARLRGGIGDAALLVLGARDDLPWADGAEYLGRDERAPALLLPTLLEPAVHPALLERALQARFPGVAGPLAVLPGLVLPFAHASAIDAERLR